MRVCSAHGACVRLRANLCPSASPARTRHVRRIGHTDDLDGATLGGRDERTSTHGIEGDVLGRIRVPCSGLVVAHPPQPVDVGLGRREGSQSRNDEQSVPSHFAVGYKRILGDVLQSATVISSSLIKIRMRHGGFH